MWKSFLGLGFGWAVLAGSAAGRPPVPAAAVAPLVASPAAAGVVPAAQISVPAVPGPGVPPPPVRPAYPLPTDGGPPPEIRPAVPTPLSLYAGATPLAGPYPDVVPLGPVPADAVPGDPAGDRLHGLMAHLPASRGGVVGECVWVNTEFVAWATKGASVAPLVTTGPAVGAGASGLIGQPGTTTLFGGGVLLNNLRPGLRVEFGGWCDDDGTVGGSGRFFFIGSEVRRFLGGGGGNAVVTLPGVNGDTPAAYPGFFQGTVNAAVSTSFAGADAVVRHALTTGRAVRVDVYAGYRYLHLGDTVSRGYDVVSATDPPELTPRVMGFDELRVRNHFHGGMVGLNGGTCWGGWTADANVSLAFGGTDVQQDASTTRSTGTGLFVVTPAVQAGRRSSQHFGAVVPEFGAKVGYAPWSFLKFTAGYDLIYWSKVARPQGRLGLDPDAGGTTDLWVQGFNLGVGLRW